MPCSTTWRSTAGSWAAARSASTCARSWPARSRCRVIPQAGMVDKFGGILGAFEYGAPPHGGIALGIDRWAALLTRPDQHPRGHGVPQDLIRLGPDARRALSGRAGPARGPGPGAAAQAQPLGRWGLLGGRHDVVVEAGSRQQAVRSALVDTEPCLWRQAVAAPSLALVLDDAAHAIVGHDARAGG